MEADLHRRTRHGATADATYVSLTILHAGLLSLADASGRLCDSYRGTLAIDPPVEGWFTEEGARNEAVGRAAAEPARESEA